jgi:RNA polymerase sigma-70 factor (ECF subfamily)
MTPRPQPIARQLAAARERSEAGLRTFESRVAAARAGDDAARASLVEALMPRARNLVRFLVRGDAESDDIVQDALVVVLERLHNYRGEGRFEHWADGVIMRVALHRLRRLRLRLRRFVSSPPHELELRSERASMPLPLQRGYLERRELVGALDRLPYKQRHALVLHYVLGMTVPEVAAELGVPRETLHSRLRVGLHNLRRHSRRLHLLPDGEDE